MDTRRSVTPVNPVVVAAALLVLPVLYVGSYWALVDHGTAAPYHRFEAGRTLFWPLEQIDRKLRPLTWG
jgi:hypothetical protein